MVWLSYESGQSVADLLALPASVYAAIRDRVAEQHRAAAFEAYRAERQEQWDELLASLRPGGAR